MVEFMDQSAGSIRLYLLKGEFDVSQFTILKQKTLTHQGMNIGIGLLGESHYATYEKGGEIFHEICACTDARFTGTEEVLIKDFLPNLHVLPVKKPALGGLYSFSFIYANWEDGEGRLAALRKRGEERHALSLKHVFPSHDKDTREPITEVYLTLTKENVIFESVHSYPNEHVMVFTESTFFN